MFLCNPIGEEPSVHRNTHRSIFSCNIADECFEEACVWVLTLKEKKDFAGPYIYMELLMSFYGKMSFKGRNVKFSWGVKDRNWKCR